MQPQADTRAAGPGAIDDATVDVRPILEGANEYEYVEILNPLPVDFIAKFAITRAVRGEVRIITNRATPTITNNEEDVRRNYGLDLRNKDHVGKANIVNRVTIKAGQTIRVLGNEAQVIVTQLVNEILQREKKNLMLADPTQRNIVEQRIIKRRNSVESMLGRPPTSIQDQLQEAVEQSNNPTEVEFPDATINKESDETINSLSRFADSTERGSTSGTEEVRDKRPVGRPAKAIPATAS